MLVVGLETPRTFSSATVRPLSFVLVESLGTLGREEGQSSLAPGSFWRDPVWLPKQRSSDMTGQGVDGLSRSDTFVRMAACVVIVRVAHSGADRCLGV